MARRAGPCYVITAKDEKGESMQSSLFRTILLAAALLSPTVQAETLPLPQNLVSAATDAGEALFLDADAREAYFPLASNFLTQKN